MVYKTLSAREILIEVIVGSERHVSWQRRGLSEAVRLRPYWLTVRTGSRASELRPQLAAASEIDHFSLVLAAATHALVESLPQTMRCEIVRLDDQIPVRPLCRFIGQLRMEIERHKISIQRPISIRSFASQTRLKRVSMRANSGARTGLPASSFSRSTKIQTTPMPHSMRAGSAMS